MDAKGLVAESRREVTQPCRRPHVQERTAGADLVLYDPVGGRLHVLNPTAAAVWRLCDGSLPTATLAGRFSEDYAVAPDQDPLADVRQVLKQLLDAGLIEDRAGSDPSTQGATPELIGKVEVNPR